MILGFWAEWRGNVKYHPFDSVILTVCSEASGRTLSGGQFNWGGCLLKSNGGVPRYPQDQ